MATKTANQLREERVEVIAKARKINDEHSDENGVLPAEHQEQFDKAMAFADELKVAADNANQLETLETALDQPAADPLRGRLGDPNAQPHASAARQAEMLSVRDGARDEHGNPTYRQIPVGERGSKEYQDAFEKALLGATNLSMQEMAALRSDDSSQAGYLVASEQMAAGILKEVDDLVFVRRYGKITTVREAASLGIRKRTSKANTFDWSSELSVSDEDTSLAYGKKVLEPHHLTGEIKVSRDLLRRSTGTAESEVRYEMGRDASETMEQAYLTGSGAQQPLGVFTPSTDGVSTARDVLTGSATNYTADQLVAAKYTLKQQYRNGGVRSGARWLFNRTGISKLSQLKDGDNHYMLQPARGLTGDEWDSLLGYPVDESEFAPGTFTTGQYVGLLCNWSYYEIADALNMEIQVLDQLYAATNQIGYIGRLKTDGMPTLEEAFVRLKTS